MFDPKDTAHDDESYNGYSTNMSEAHCETFNDTYEDTFVCARSANALNENDNAGVPKVTFLKVDSSASVFDRGFPQGANFGEPSHAGPYLSPSASRPTTTNSHASTHTLVPTASNTIGFMESGYSVTITAIPPIPVDPDLTSPNPYKRFMARTRARRAARERDLHLMAGVELLPNAQQAGMLEGWRKTAVAIGIALVVLASTVVAGALVASSSLNERPYSK